MEILFFRIYKGACIAAGLFVTLLLSDCKKKSTVIETTANKEMTPFKELSNNYLGNLQKSILHLDSLQTTVDESLMKYHFLKARMHFKMAEPLLSFVDVENYKYLNQPNILKVEEEDATDIKIHQPTGFQVLEEELFTESAENIQIKKHAKNTQDRLQLIVKNTLLEFLKKHHLLWSIRDAIIRVALTGVTGFDSPILENSIVESNYVYQSIKIYLKLFKGHFKDDKLYQKWQTELIATANILEGDFNSFDRYKFIKEHTHLQLELWNRTVKDWNVQFPFEMAINNNAISLFSLETFNINHFSQIKEDRFKKEKIALGKELFHDKTLSANNNISCATCHQPEKAYTDGKKHP